MITLSGFYCVIILGKTSYISIEHKNAYKTKLSEFKAYSKPTCNDTYQAKKFTHGNQALDQNREIILLTDTF